MPAALALLLAAAPHLRPTPAAQRRAAVLDAPALVEVKGPHAHGRGVVVGEAGTVLTTVDFVGLHTASVEVDGKRLKARVLAADARLRLAVLKLPSGTYFAAPARLTSKVDRGEWLFALVRRGPLHPERKHEVPESQGRHVSRTRDLPSQSAHRAGHTTPREVRVTRVLEGRPSFEVSRRLPPGVPLLDRFGRMVALVVARTAHGARALLLPAVKTELAKGRVH